MKKAERVLVKASALQGIKGALLLREVIAEVFRKAITRRIGKGISSCFKNKLKHSHWLEQVLPGRIATALTYPHHDRLLNSGNMHELKYKLLVTLFNRDKECSSSDAFYFEIVERHLLLKMVKGHEGEDLVEMIFYEHSEENPDKNLQEILLGMFEERADIMTTEE